MTYDRHWVLWDGECGFCRKTVHWLQSKDQHAAFQVIPYQEAPVPPMTAELRASCKNAVHVVTRDGQILKGGAACVFLLKVLGYPVPEALLKRAPFNLLLERGYRLIANNRRLVSRLVFRG